LQYDAPYEVELRHPITDENIGVTVSVTSANSPAAKRVQMQNQARLMAMNLGKNKEKSEAEILALLEKQVKKTVEQLAACVTGWNWGGKTFGKLGKDPEFTPANVSAVLDTDWIFDQVNDAVSDIANFTKG
jgi:hypothetical protein